MAHCRATFDYLYNTHSAMLYGIALEFSSTAEQAEEILTLTFQKLFLREIIESDSPSFCANLIKLVIETAKEQQVAPYHVNNFKLKRSVHTPILDQLLFEQGTLEDFCNTQKLTRHEVGQKLRKEFWLLTELSKTNIPVMRSISAVCLRITR